MKTTSSRPWRMVLPLLIVILLCMAWSIFWFVALALVQDFAERQRTQAARTGVTLTCTNETWGGFPFRFEFTCTGPVVGYLESYRLEASRFQAIVQAYYPWHVIVLLDGPTMATGPDHPPQLIIHDRAIASFRFRGNQEPDMSMELPNVKFGEVFEAKTVRIYSRPESGDSHGVAVSMTGIHHQRPGHPPLDIENADLLSTLQPDHALAVHSLDLKQQGVIWHGLGTVQLDSRRRISGTLHTDTNSLDGLLAILEPHLEMTEEQRAAFKTVMGLLGQQAKAEIIAKDGELYIGPFKIADLIALY